jgi:hypothetical protein
MRIKIAKNQIHYIVFAIDKPLPFIYGCQNFILPASIIQPFNIRNSYPELR